MLAPKGTISPDGPQIVNRVVEITNTLEQKIDANLANVTQGPAGKSGSTLARKLAEEGKYLLILGSDDQQADRNYIKHFVLDIDSESGRSAFTTSGPASPRSTSTFRKTPV